MPEARIVTLVDFDNDCVGTSLAVARALGRRLSGVRLDTSEAMVDRSIVPQMGDFDPRGVNPQLVRNVRAALDADGFDYVQITASGGFTPEKILRFEREHAPVDSYGSDRTCSAGRSTSPRTSSRSTASRWPSRGAGPARIPAWNGSTSALWQNRARGVRAHAPAYQAASHAFLEDRGCGRAMAGLSAAPLAQETTTTGELITVMCYTGNGAKGRGDTMRRAP